MNEYGLTRVSAMIPEVVYRAFQVAAARDGVTLPMWVRNALFKAADVNESQVASLPIPKMRLTPARRAILTFLETHPGYVTTQDIVHGHTYSRPTIYNTVQDMVREGFVERGENQALSSGAGAPCKTYRITEMGKRALQEVRDATRLAHEEIQTRASDQLAPIRAQADADTFKPKLQTALKYVAMARLGRAIEGEADLEWMEAEHDRLVGVALADVSKGASTFEALYTGVMAHLDTLGGFEAISQRFNVG